MRATVEMPIRRKLTLAMMLASGLALAVTMAVIATYDLATFRSRAIRDLEAQAELIGSSTQGAVHFDDAATARTVLAGLKTKRDVIAASVYKADGTVLAAYRREDVSGFAFPDPRSGADRIESDHLGIFRPIRSDGETIGIVYLCYGLESVYARLSRYAALVGVAALALMVAYFSLSALLARLISRPILSLSEAVRTVTGQRDYRVRVEKQAGDELGQLTDAFNQMLETIAAREGAVQRANQELEERTRQLQVELMERQRAQEALQQSEEKNGAPSPKARRT